MYNFEDFTEYNYRELIRLAKQRYEFISFKDYKKPGNNLLMRHDIDFSVHRAHALAKIEAEEGVRSTYFLWLHSKYYNLFEEEIAELVYKILGLGHDIGLHFDYDFYEKRFGSINTSIGYEKSLLEYLFDAVPAMSFHNITETSERMFEWYQGDKYHGMINAHSQYIRENYEYCSDSNGYWRFKRLEDVLIQSTHNLHVLIHPEWWTPEPMSPRDRISRCIKGRAKNNHMWYDSTMKKIGRENIDSKGIKM